jgi:hypothetical protein
MATTFTKIASVSVGSGGASSIDFTSIPSTYTDLCIKLSARSNAAAANYDLMFYRFNADSTNSYIGRWLSGDGSTTYSNNQTATAYAIPRYAIPAATATSNTFGSLDMYIPNYAGSNYKSVAYDSASENNATAGYLNMQADLWQKTNIITSFSISPYNGSLFLQYSTATLYGIKNS